MASKLDAALALAAKGFKVFPIKPGVKAPPLLNGWPQKATSDPELIAQYWLPVPDANIGLHCNGLLVIDVDPRKGGDESLELLDILGGLPPTLTARTPTGGRHLYFLVDRPVPNSVSVLGAGLDIRSAGGYVVAPGSDVAAGSYEWEHEGVAIAQAPEWLVLKAGTIVPKKGTQSPELGTAPALVLETAREWLAGQEGAVEGQGGDATTYAAACGLRDRGVSAAQAAELMAEWNARCSPPWSADALTAKVRNAYAYAQNDPGARVALPDDFPLIDNIGIKSISAQNTRQVNRVLSLSEFATQESRSAGYVVKGLLQRRSYASTYGAPGEGKTFVALDLAYHVAAGLPWMERRVHAGPVLYLAFEGTGGMVKRAQALRQKYGTADTPLYIAGAAMNLRDHKGRAELGDLIAALPDKPVLIVFDTFARALCGGDENSAQDVGAFNSAIAALIDSTGACVTIVHHSGKDKSKGARGSSALLGALDTEIEIDDGKVCCRKQRDIEISEPIGFKLTPLVVGIDADGDDSTSCVIEPAEVVAGLKRLTGNAKNGFDVLCDKWPSNKPVDPRDWRDACMEFLPAKRAAGSFHEMKKALLRSGHIVIDDNGFITRRMT